MSPWFGLSFLRGRRGDGDPVAEAAAPVEADAGPLRLFRAGRTDEALQRAKERLAADPSDVESLQVQGLAAFDAQDSATALRVFDQIVRLQPAHVDGWVGLGRARGLAGRRAAAQEALDHARSLDADDPGALVEMAVLCVAAGNADQAIGLLDEAASGDARSAHARYLVANLLLERGRPDEALRHLQVATHGGTGPAEAHANLGALWKDRGDTQQACVHLEKALQLAPGLATAAYNLAMVRIEQRKWEEAASLLRQSLKADPRQPDAQYWLGNALMGQGDAAEARKAYQSALRLNGGFVKARWGNAMAQLPVIAMNAAEQDAAPRAFAGELQKLKSWLATHRDRNAFEAVGAQQPYYLAYIGQDHRAVLGEYGQLCASLMADWSRQAGLPKPAVSGGKRKRVGIVSAHIHSHSVWHAILRGWLEHLDAKRFEIHLFHTGAGTDAQTQWASRRVDRLHHGLGDWAAWAKAISATRCDVLVYPEIGMDATTVRLSALRLAPMQLASWGHPITTGLPTIDAFLSAEAFEPADAQRHYTEKLIALPRLGCAYRPYDTASRKADLAAWGIAPGDRVLVCAGNPFKYAPAGDDLFVEVARRCRPCKLLFFGASSDLKVALLERRLRDAFGTAGIDFDQHVRFVPWLTQEHFFGLLGQADVFLDSAGFSGFNTAMQAVETGIPIVAWEGAFMRGRFASGILRQMGLDEWVADSVEGFASRVEALCSDGARGRVGRQIAEAKRGLFDDRASVDGLATLLESPSGGA